MKNIKTTLLLVTFCMITLSYTMQEKELELIAICRQKQPDLKRAKKLLKSKTTPNATDKGRICTDYYYFDNPGTTALGTAVYEGHIELVELLLKRKADIEIKSPWNGSTPLIKAALQGHTKITEVLIARGANVNATNCCKNTALMWASDYAHVEIVKLLLAASADVTCKNDEGITALHNAKTKAAISYRYHDRYDQIVDLLEKAGATE